MKENKTYKAFICVDELGIEMTVAGFSCIEDLKLHSASFVKRELLKRNFADGEFAADIVISDSNGDYVDSDSVIVKFENGNISFIAA